MLSMIDRKEGNRMKSSIKHWESTNPLIPKATRNVINGFLEKLITENYSERTIIKYRRIIEQFFVECKAALEELKPEDVLAWLNQFSAGKRERTIDLYLSALSSFFKFCLAEDYVERKLIKKRWRPRIPKSLPKYLTQNEYSRVKLAAEKMSPRDRALVTFLFDTGCRKSEVVSLKIRDVDLKKRTVKVIGKGKKIRYVHFSEECKLALSNYLSTRESDETEPLFITKFKNGIKGGGIELVIKKVGEMAGLERRLFPHCCRHTFATNMLANGADLSFIAEEMGHEDLNTTRIYTRIPTEDLMNNYRQRME